MTSFDLVQLLLDSLFVQFRIFCILTTSTIYHECERKRILVSWKSQSLLIGRKWNILAWFFFDLAKHYQQILNLRYLTSRSFWDILESFWTWLVIVLNPSRTFCEAYQVGRNFVIAPEQQKLQQPQHTSEASHQMFNTASSSRPY